MNEILRESCRDRIKEIRVFGVILEEFSRQLFHSSSRVRGNNMTFS
jgi:hypothetical protein